MLKGFLEYLDTNSNLKILATNHDNKKAIVHRWFPFLVGFSNALVKETIGHFNKDKGGFAVFDPFMGSGTTAIACKELGVNVVGNESNEFLYDVCQAKINSGKYVNEIELLDASLDALKTACRTWKSVDISNEHEILGKCFYHHNLRKLVALRNAIHESDFDETVKSFCFIGLTRSLNKAARVGLNIPYVSWKNERIPKNAFSQFEDSISLILKDVKTFSKTVQNHSNMDVYLHDSRKPNLKIDRESIDMIFTSPPYLNNFDYGESLKIFMYFWKYVSDWRDITDKVRKKSLVSATTYYDKKYLVKKSASEVLGGPFVDELPSITEQLEVIVRDIREVTSKRNKSKKSFDLLTLLYFRDMFSVLSEMYRVLKKNSLACIVIGDSAPYGIYVPTDTLLGDMALGIGFSSFTKKPLRIRGTKWTTLRYRHNLKLRESLLILRK
jgi:DNA modification methylase